ncbi:MAG: formate dehydrogenase accessory sulfurtransferase FdhD [candidate division NC10 bacterium]
MGIYRFKAGRFEALDKEVVTERPLTIFVNGQELATMMSTPFKLDFLVVGFLSFEGIIRDLSEIASLEIHEEMGLVEVTLTKPFTPPTRRVFTSGCSGGITFSLALQQYPPILTDELLRPEQVYPLMRQLFDACTLYNATRGVHGAALSDGEKLLIAAEDVGRHNALDKIMGEALLREIPTRGRLLLSTGRISSEMLRKGAHMGTPFIISRTSPTSLAIEGAKQLGITLIGYARGDGFNLYTHPERILYTPAAEPAPAR